MARRKQEVQLQQDIETQEEWEEMLSKDGVYVVDIYQEWSGPCRGMISNLRRLKNELGDDLLKFAVAKADTIDALEKYRGKCEPCFLFFASGSLVAVIRGANSPLVLRTITEQLAQEHKVLDGSSERKEIKDPEIAALELREKAALDEDEHEKEEEEEAKKQVTVAIIKPDAVEAGKVDEIIEQMKESGLEILKQEERHLTEDEAREFYSHLGDEDFFEELVKFMSSGPSCVCVLSKGKAGENVVEEWRDMIGPTSVEEAKQQAPASWRAKYGSDRPEKFMNALHGSSSQEQATRELAFFFPDYAVPSVAGKPKLQRTLALIRPDAFRLHKDEILGKIRESGFKVAMQKEVSLDKEQAEEFYKEHKGQPYFELLTTRMSSGPLMALGLARDDAIQGWREMLGPKEVDKAKEEAPDSLRAQFAIEDVALNQLHGSDSEETARKELEYFFPVEQTVAVIKPDANATKDEIVEKIHEAGFRIAARKETTLSREIAEEFYADHKGKEYYNDLVESMCSGPTYFMVLSREDAVEGWRQMIGPTDPDKAKDEDPESIRAIYGSSVLKNAVHGSSTADQASKSIKQIFGDLRFETDGTVEEEDTAEGEEKPQSPQKEEGEKPEAEKPATPTQEKTDEAVVQKSDDDAQDAAPEERERLEEAEKAGEGESKAEEETKPAEGAETKQGGTTSHQMKNDDDDKKDHTNYGQERSAEVKENQDEHKKETDKDDDKKSDTKADDKKSDTKAHDKKSDTKADDDKKSDTKADDRKSETKADDRKSETKADDKKSDTKAHDKKSDTKADDKKSDTKADDKKSKTKADDKKKDEAKPAEEEGEAKAEEQKEDEPKQEASKEEEKKEEEGKEAEKKDDDTKAEAVKEDDKKEDDKKEYDKKEDDKKEDDKKEDDKKEDDKKEDDIKEDDKKEDDKKEDDKKEDDKKEDTAKPDEQKAEG